MERPPSRRCCSDGNPQAAGSCSRSPGYWGSLPEHLLLPILMKLNFVDFSSFRRVCRAWRSAANGAEQLHAASQPPLLQHLDRPQAVYCIDEGRYLNVSRPTKLNDGDDGSDGVRRLQDKHIIRCFSCGYFIVSESREDSAIVLAHPLTGAIVDGVVFPEVALGYECLLLTAPPPSPGCVLVALDRLGSIRYCRPGDSRWKAHQLFDRSTQRMLFRHGHLQFLTPCKAAILDGKVHVMVKNELLVIDLVPELRLTRIQTEGLTSREMFPYLVECGGELLAVDGLKQQTLTVHRFEASARRWAPMNDLRGHAIAMDDGLFGCCCSWKASTAPGGGDEGGNRVYFQGSQGVFVYHLVHGRMELHRHLEVHWWEVRWIVPSLFPSLPSLMNYKVNHIGVS